MSAPSETSTESTASVEQEDLGPGKRLKLKPENIWDFLNRIRGFFPDLDWALGVYPNMEPKLKIACLESDYMDPQKNIIPVEISGIHIVTLKKGTSTTKFGPKKIMLNPGLLEKNQNTAAKDMGIAAAITAAVAVSIALAVAYTKGAFDNSATNSPGAQPDTPARQEAGASEMEWRQEAER